MITLNHYLILASALFAIGFAGVVLRRNMITLLMSIELMLNAVNITLAGFSRIHGNLEGQMVAFFVIILAAAEAAVGLAIIVLVFRRRGSVQSTELGELRDVTDAH